jgi:hypothetical protein
MNRKLNSSAAPGDIANEGNEDAATPAAVSERKRRRSRFGMCGVYLPSVNFLKRKELAGQDPLYEQAICRFAPYSPASSKGIIRRALCEDFSLYG